MKNTKWQIKLGIMLLILSAVLYYINYIVFHDLHHMFVFLLEDLAFIPIEVLVVTLIIDRVIEKREKQHLIQKLNIIIGVFFTEAGTEILKFCASNDENVGNIKDKLIITNNWSDSDFNNAVKIINNHTYSIKIEDVDFEKVKSFLVSKKDFTMRLLENPNLIEHETFTELLNSILHLEQELIIRDISTLSKDDIEHMEIDVKRVYKYILTEWVYYMRHLKKKYPYLFVTAIDNNPFKKM
ncbi:hypothetical protein [Tepidibacter aestuarii]|uniref:hypothetical protein n=1 Tax=Tepidibacter aestuarii TaxID=2925782 RepID=UPI0020BE8A2A|nr:hypothetical protein [Tepidibacter aestuarii]CAH2214155.1 conserved protein of unknown function [Tepidibacter aestuarii]